MHKRVKYIVCVLTLLCGLYSSAQRQYEPHFAVGAKGGMSFSRMEFVPGVEQTMNMGMILGFQARYTEENFFGLIGELNLVQGGWQEVFDETQFSYSRTLTYIQLPILTHIYFGGKNFKGFVNLGPSVSYLIGDNISSNFDYRNPTFVQGFPYQNRRLNQMKMEVENKFDYGITAGLGMELIIKRRHSLLLEGRYYYGLGNIFPDAKKDEFSASRGSSIHVTLGYLFHLK
ncbi:MAG: PorT family protein [Paramuribaculum sp.]|nr:PorT family protein [Paramuribaculum sp.]